MTCPENVAAASSTNLSKVDLKMSRFDVHHPTKSAAKFRQKSQTAYRAYSTACLLLFCHSHSFTTFHNFPCYESTWHATLLRSISHPPQLAPGMQWVCSFRRWHQGWAFGAAQLRFRHLKNWHDNHDITNWFCYAQFSWKPCSSMHSSMHIHHIHTMSYLFHSQLCRWSNNSLSNLYAHGESEAVGAWYQIYPACPEDLTLWVGVAWPGRPGSWSVPPPKFGQREGGSGSASSLPSMKTYENYGDSRARTKNDIDWNSPGYSSMK